MNIRAPTPFIPTPNAKCMNQSSMICNVQRFIIDHVKRTVHNLKWSKFTSLPNRKVIILHAM